MICSELFIKSMVDLAKGHNISHLAAALAGEIGKAVIICDPTNRVVAFDDPSETKLSVGEFFPLDFRKSEDIGADFFAEINQFKEGRWETENGLVNYIYFPIKAPGKVYGNCIVLCTNRELQPDQRATIQQMSLVYLLALREIANKETEREWLLDEIVYDVLYNNYDSKLVLYEKARHLHWDLDGPYAVIVIETDPDKIQTVRKAGPAQFNSMKPVYTIINEKVVVVLSLINLPGSQIKQAITKFATAFLDNLAFSYIKDVHMGISSVGDALTDLHQCFQEAKIALELGKVFNMGNINYFDDMGFLKFIFTAPAQELQEFEQRVLGKIIAHDLEAETDLLNTLRTYVNQQGQIASCAKALYIHENTLRNRLKKIEQLLGFDLNRVDHLVNIYVALQILNMDDYGEN